MEILSSVIKKALHIFLCKGRIIPRYHLTCIELLSLRHLSIPLFDLITKITRESLLFYSASQFQSYLPHICFCGLLSAGKVLLFQDSMRTPLLHNLFDHFVSTIIGFFSFVKKNTILSLFFHNPFLFFLFSSNFTDFIIPSSPRRNPVFMLSSFT